MFKNLFSLSGSRFNDHNFTDYGNLDYGGDSLRQITSDEILEMLKVSFRPDPERPGSTLDLPPKFLGTLRLTLAEVCYNSFIRANPATPIYPRDYYLSKVFQFVYLLLVARFDYETVIHSRQSLHRVLDQLQSTHMPPDTRISLADLLWESYSGCLVYERPPRVLVLLRRFLRNALNPPEPGSQPGTRGPARDTKNQQLIWETTERCTPEGCTKKGKALRKYLPQICAQLDGKEVPASNGRGQKTTMRWSEKLELPGGPEKVCKAIERACEAHLENKPKP